jgi:hypothetical protein
MTNQQTRDKQPRGSGGRSAAPTSWAAGRLGRLGRLIQDKVLAPIRREIRRRAGERELQALDERTLRDLGLQRWETSRAVYGLIDEHPRTDPSRGTGMDAERDGASDVASHRLRSTVAILAVGPTPVAARQPPRPPRVISSSRHDGSEAIPAPRSVRARSAG